MPYIDKEKVIERINYLCEVCSEPPMDRADEIRLNILRKLENDFNKLPTFDVVEVVRCKDCKYSRKMDKYEKSLYLESCVGCTYHSTSYHSLIMQGDDHCSYGERKEDSK